MRAFSRSGTSFTLLETQYSGGEGRIYKIDGRTHLLAKVFHRERLSVELHRKIVAMVSSAPKDPTLELRGHRSIAWPQELLYSDAGQRDFIGFTMPALDALRFRESHTYFDPADRLRRFAGAFTWKHLLLTAYNISSAVAAIHERGHRIGDLRDSNILVAPNSLVSLIDCDSFQIVDPSGVSYPTRVGTGEYLPPELQKADFRSAPVDRYHSDLFALSVLVFKLLMLGAHPFQARGVAVQDLPSTEAKILRGIYPYTRSKGAEPPEFAPDVRILPPNLRKLADRTFVEGHTKPERRPSADDWFKAIGVVGPQLKTCRKNPHHLYGGHLRSCPWCEIASRGPDPFPSPRAGSQTAAAEASEQPRVKRIPQPTRQRVAPHPQPPPPRDLAHLKQMLAQRMQEPIEKRSIFAAGAEASLLLLVALLGLAAPLIAAAGVVVVVIPLLATVGLALQDRETGTGQLRIAIKAGPLALQGVTQSLYHFIPPGLVLIPIAGGLYLAATRLAHLPARPVLQVLGSVVATGWSFAVLHFLDSSDQRLVAPARRACRTISEATVRTRLGRLRVAFLLPLLAIVPSAFLARGAVTLWPL
ncbi:MAG TPA: hypothetical protein VNA87_00170 [Actinomycetota bacterium]|nr:hypothetical protein [Actinomycetota bacterium]